MFFKKIISFMHSSQVRKDQVVKECAWVLQRKNRRVKKVRPISISRTFSLAGCMAATRVRSQVMYVLNNMQEEIEMAEFDQHKKIHSQQRTLHY
jgi:hypothetical protein